MFEIELMIFIGGGYALSMPSRGHLSSQDYNKQYTCSEIVCVCDRDRGYLDIALCS